MDTPQEQPIQIPEANPYELLGRKEVTIASLLEEVKRLRTEIERLSRQPAAKLFAAKNPTEH
jgi:hypothetical protein